MDIETIKLGRRIFFITPENKFASGGVKQIYKMVDHLNENGYNAFVLHKNKGFREVWFENSSNIDYNSLLFSRIKAILKNKNTDSIKYKFKFLFYKWKDEFYNNIKFNDDDIFVFPEIFQSAINSLPINNNVVIFNQNCYYTFESFQNKNLENFQVKNLLANITVSLDSLNYLNLIFPNSLNSKIRLGIETSKFFLQTDKKKQICYMPRKLNEDVFQVISILKIRGLCSDWSFVEIDGFKEDKVASIMRESAIFLSFNYREGFGLPPVEAMSCGCIVIGYTGNGGNEYFEKPFAYTIQDRNIHNYVLQVEDIILKIEKGEINLEEIGLKISNYCNEIYNKHNEKDDILNIWKKIVTI